MCTLCKTFGRQQITNEGKLATALMAIGARIPSEHNDELIGIWIGEPTPEFDAEADGEWERNQREDEES